MAQLCEEFNEWVEEEIEKPVKKWREKRIEKCKKRKCKKWCLCCNKWFCWIEIVLVAVITFIIITVGKWVVRIICWTISVAISAIAGIIGIILSIPIIGRLLKLIWNVIIEIVWRIIGLGGVLLDILGLDFQKKMRICVIILKDDKTGNALTTPTALQPEINTATQIWKDAANVKLIVEDIHTVVEDKRWKHSLDVGCDSAAFSDDLLVTGSNFQLLANTYCFYGTGRRFIGFAAPIVVFAVRDVKGKRGCSLGPFAEYVTIEAQSPGCLAHELGHANYPNPFAPHHGNPDNLMHSSCRGTKLKKWQKIFMRDSRFITYI